MKHPRDSISPIVYEVIERYTENIAERTLEKEGKYERYYEQSPASLLSSHLFVNVKSFILGTPAAFTITHSDVALKISQVTAAVLKACSSCAFIVRVIAHRVVSRDFACGPT